MTRPRSSIALVLRALGTAGAGLSVSMAAILVIGVWADPSAQSAWWHLVGPSGVGIAAVGVWAWWRGRWWVAAVGMWVATFADIAWYGAALLPFSLAVTATTLAIRSIRAPHGSVARNSERG